MTDTMKILALALLCGAVGQAAHAQVSENTRPHIAGPSNVPLAAGETIPADFKYRVIAYHDTNVTRTSPALAALRGLTLEDTVVQAALLVDVSPSDNTGPFVRGQVGVDLYSNNDQLNRERIDLTGGWRFRSARCGSQAGTRYARRLSELDDLTVETDANNLEQQVGIFADVRCTRDAGLSVRAAATYDETDNSTELRSRSNQETGFLRAGATLARPGLGNLSLMAMYQNTQFPRRTLTANLRFVNDGFEMYGADIVFERRVGYLVQGEALIGYRSVEPTSPGVPGFDGGVYGISIDVLPQRRFRARGLFERSVKTASRLDVTYSVEELASVEGQFVASERLVLATGFSNLKRDYRVPAALARNVTAQDTDKAFVSVRYKTVQEVVLALEVAEEKRKTNNPLYDFDHTRVSLTAEGIF